jgi:hypothetical protein
MKKQIEVKTESTKVIEVEVPSYHNFYGKVTAITDTAVICACPAGHYIFCTLSENKDAYNKAIDDTLRYSGTVPATKEEFETAFNKTIKCLTEQYQLSMSMQDPNLAAAGQEQATEQNAGEANNLESASQDQAMEANAEEATEG